MDNDVKGSTVVTVFDNSIFSAGITLNVSISPGAVGVTVIDVDVTTSALMNSILFKIEKNTDLPNSWNLELCSLETIKRLKLLNETIHFNAIIDNSRHTFNISILQLLGALNSNTGSLEISVQDKTLIINFGSNIADKIWIKEFIDDFSSMKETHHTNTLVPPPSNKIYGRSIRSSTALSSSIRDSTPNSNSNSSLLQDESGSELSSSVSALSMNNTNTTTVKQSKLSKLKLLCSNSNSSSSVNNQLNGYQDDTDGFLILQIESAVGLPPFKNSTHLSYDMDPFVVVSFSKQNFKTSVCKHTLNPIWKNQLMNIRVSKYSFNFQLNLSVYDFDYFTFNENICFANIEISKLIDESEHNKLDSWTYKKILLKFSDNANNKINLQHKLKKNYYQPELSVRFKYVSVQSLQAYPHSFNPKFERCPNCNKLDKRNSSALQHLSICTLNLKPSHFLNKRFITSKNASRRWYSKVLAHIAYGRLTVGGNNAHILVQHRETGLVLEEKISAFVKLGIRLLYKSVKSDNSSEKIKRMLRLLSIKQGLRYDHPDSRKKIKGFIKFHGLDSSIKEECLDSNIDNYKSFNDFFSRKLKPGSRPLEGGNDNNIVVSMADSRLIVYDNITDCQKLWIKGSGFTVNKLLGKACTNNVEDKVSIAIFRLAPQDYHRVHIPLNGKIVKINHIHGSYYTVNPMAIRSRLDVFGENVRTIITLETEEYGLVEMVLVGAMMVGSIIISVDVGDEVKKGQELGYFKFGGSTAILIMRNNDVKWDGDLVSNSNKSLETLVKVGMSVGHSIHTEEFKRNIKEKVSDSERREIIRRVTGLAITSDETISTTFKNKIGEMFEDVKSLSKSIPMAYSSSEEDWEVKELTTLDGVNDIEVQEMTPETNAMYADVYEGDVYEVLNDSLSDLD